MRSIKTDPQLTYLEKRVLHYADSFNRVLPEIRFFILDSMEFASLLIKNVYPTSPVNVWEGKQMAYTRHRIETGQESSLYYEVVQTGRPSYAYLNSTNNAMMQASVMAHVVGHCEFSELNVMGDSTDDRTEFVMYLSRKVERCRQQMGERNYRMYWNACESVKSLIAVNSQFNVNNSIETDTSLASGELSVAVETSFFDSLPFSSTVSSLLQESLRNHNTLIQKDVQRTTKRETLSWRGYKIKAPCQDVMGFLRQFAPKSVGEAAILDYMYTINSTQEFVIRTQIMNEGWAMYWENKIMMELFKEKACDGIIDYCKAISGVCYPRPYFMRNPYHLGYHMWRHIEQLYKDGKVCTEYFNEKDLFKKQNWSVPSEIDPLEAMKNIVQTCTDYEFLRRFLTVDLVEKFYLNRIDKLMAQKLGVKATDVYKEDQRWIWLDPNPVKEEMLQFFTHLHKPRIYVIDVDFMEGGLLLYHRDDGRALRKSWIKPTLANINLIWKGPVALLTKDTIYSFSSGRFESSAVEAPAFDTIMERMLCEEKPFRMK